MRCGSNRITTRDAQCAMRIAQLKRQRQLLLQTTSTAVALQTPHDLSTETANAVAVRR